MVTDDIDQAVSNDLSPDFVGIRVDDREPTHHRALIQSLRARTAVTIARTDFTDYSFRGSFYEELGRRPSIGIEYATISDFIGKIDNNRLSHQLSGILQRYDVCILLLEGPFYPDDNGYVKIHGVAKSGMDYDRATSTLDAAQAHGVIVKFSRDKEESARRILREYTYWNKEVSEHKLFRPVRPLQEFSGFLPLAPEVERHVQVMMAYPGVGEKKAMDALETLGSIEMMHMLPESELVKIPGWGMTGVRAFKAFIAERVFDD